MTDFELMNEVLTDAEVKWCRFLADERTSQVNFCEIEYNDGSDAILVRHGGKWDWARRSPTDAATATGMYDHD